MKIQTVLKVSGIFNMAKDEYTKAIDKQIKEQKKQADIK